MIYRNDKGFTIIEVLISMVILAIGILGLGVLQLTAMQNTQGGYLRSQATILAYDIMDAMRTNIPAVSNGDHQIAFAAVTPTAADCYGAGADCTLGQIAGSDVSRWRSVLRAYLPSGNGQVETVDLGNVTRVTVSVSWIDPYSAESGNELLVLVAELTQ